MPKFKQTKDNTYYRHWFRWYLLASDLLLPIRKHKRRMTDKEFRTQTARIQKYLDKYQRPLGFNWWEISHEFCRQADNEHGSAAGITRTQWEYRQAHIQWIIPNLINSDDDELDELVLHELCHILLGPIECFTDKYADRTELAPTNVQRAINWAFKAGEKHVKSK